MEGIWFRKKRATAVHRDKRTMKSNKENGVYAAHVAGVDQQISAVFRLEDAAASHCTLPREVPLCMWEVFYTSFVLFPHSSDRGKSFTHNRLKCPYETSRWCTMRFCKPQTCVYVSAFKFLILNFALMFRLSSATKYKWLWLGKHHDLAWNKRLAHWHEGQLINISCEHDVRQKGRFVQSWTYLWFSEKCQRFIQATVLSWHHSCFLWKFWGFTKKVILLFWESIFNTVSTLVAFFRIWSHSQPNNFVFAHIAEMVLRSEHIVGTLFDGQTAAAVAMKPVTLRSRDSLVRFFISNSNRVKTQLEWTADWHVFNLSPRHCAGVEVSFSNDGFLILETNSFQVVSHSPVWHHRLRHFDILFHSRIKVL